MAEEESRALSQGHLSVDQLQQELHAKELVLEALQYENTRLREHSARHYDSAPPQDWKSYDTLKNKVGEYQNALEQRDHFIGKLEAGMKQLMQKNLESEAKGRQAEEHYSGEIQTLVQHVQQLTTQLSLMSDQHQAAMRATQEHFTQQLADTKHQMREKHESEMAVQREQHALEMKGVTVLMEDTEKRKKEEYNNVMEQLTHSNTTLGAQLEKEIERVATLLREKEEWEVYKKELEAEAEEKENLRKSLDEHFASSEELQERMRKQAERLMKNEERINSLQKFSESLSQNLRVEMERKKELETKLEEEICKSRRLFEQKTESEVKAEQLTLQLLAAEEDLAKISASRETNLRKIESLEQEKETLTQENIALSRDKETLIQEKDSLVMERESLAKEKVTSSVEKELLTKENSCLLSNNEALTKELEGVTLKYNSTAKEKEQLDAGYKILNEEKEAMTLENSRLLEGIRKKEEENQHLLKELQLVIQTKDSLMEERDNLVSERKDSVREKDMWLKESASWLTEKEDMLTEKDNLIVENKNLRSEKVMFLQEIETLSGQVESLSSEKSVLLKGKEELSALIESLREEKEVLVKERNSLISEKHSWAEEKNVLLQETDMWATEKETLLSGKETLLAEKKSLITEKEAMDKIRENLEQQNESLCQEKEAWLQKEKLLNKKNESLTTKIEDLAMDNKSLGEEKENLAWKNECLCQENRTLAEERKDLLTQVKELKAEKELLSEEMKDYINKVTDLVTEKETLLHRITSLQSERIAPHEDGGHAKETAESEVKSLDKQMEDRRPDRQQVGNCDLVDVTENAHEEEDNQTAEANLSNLQDFEESDKEKYLSKERELKQLEEHFRDKLSQKAKESWEEYSKILLEKDNELTELKEIIAVNESELQQYRSKKRAMEELHKNCLSLLERLQSSEEERKRIEEECEDKCDVLNSVLRSVDVKLSEAAALVTQQKNGSAVEAGKHTKPAGEAGKHTMEMKGKESQHETTNLKEELDNFKRKLEERRRNEGALMEKLTRCEKEKKELCNEAERLENKIHEQHFIIKSLHNEKLRLGQHITQLEEERKSLKAAEITTSKDHLKTQEELSALKVKVRGLEHNLKLQEEKMVKLHQTLTQLLQTDTNSPEKLRDMLASLSSHVGVVSLRTSERTDEPEPLWLSSLCQELEEQWKHQQSYLECMSDLQQQSDTLQQEKLQTDLENISLRAELDSSRQWRNRREEEEVGVVIEAKEGEDQFMELSKLKQENKLLQECLASNNVLMRQEKLQKLCTKPKFERELRLRVEERRCVVQVVVARLHHLIAHWTTQAQTQADTPHTITPFVQEFSSCVEELSNHLLGSSCANTTMDIEAAVSCLQQAFIKVVSGEYHEAVNDTLKSLEQDLNQTLHHLSLPPDLNATHRQPSHQDSSQQQPHHTSSSLPEDHHCSSSSSSSSSSSLHEDYKHSSSLLHKGDQNTQSFLHDLTGRVEQLINVRTALVDAANELDEELEETISQRITLLKEQLQVVLCSQSGETEKLPCPAPHTPDHKAFIQEFTDFTTQVTQDAHSEKVEVLRSQQVMVHTILEDNQAKLRKVCQGFLATVQELTSVEGLGGKMQSLVDTLESTLAKEVVWVKQQYRDLLHHYIQEQEVNSQACVKTCHRLTQTLTHLLHSAQPQDGSEVLTEGDSGNAVQLQHKQVEKIQHLEAQLAAKDQETLKHLQGVYNDRDCYKKTVELLSHATIQLLHYYSVAQNLIHQPEQEHTTFPHPAEEATPSKVVDLSFRSDCGGEEGEMLAFSEDGVLATGLVGRLAFGNDGEAEDVESALDNTGVSEGMLDDFDKDEQVRVLLERSHPQLMAILRGRCDMVQVAALEKEIQELTISLQASAGMLKIFIHSVSSDRSDLSSHTLKGEAQEESVQDSALEASHSQSSPECSDVKDGSLASPDQSCVMQEAGKSVVLPSRPVLQQDLSTLSEGLLQLLSQEESLPSFTMLCPHDPLDKGQLKAILSQLCEAAQATATLRLDLHHTKSLQQGLEEERHTLQEEVARLTHYNRNLARELQVLKDRLEEVEGEEGKKTTSKYAAKWESKKDIRERASAALTAKNAVQMGQEELEARVRELELLLEEVVKESDTALEVLRARETDLTQQLEVADRQLKSSRQFLEEHASERDQEVEELVAARDKLSLQVKEQEAQLALQGTKDREICDLREIIHSLESQAECRCSREAELSRQTEVLEAALAQAQQEVQRLSAKVEELQQQNGARHGSEASTEESSHSIIRDVVERESPLLHKQSLLSELNEDSLLTSTMLQQLEKRLGDTTRGLEVMQLSGSVEDISAQEVEVTVVGAEGRVSPATVDRRLQDQVEALEHTTEAAIKRHKDLQLTINNMHKENDEVTAERDSLQERCKEQLVKISGLEARLDEMRHTDHPAQADMRQRVTLLQEDLEAKRTDCTKKAREIEELKHSLSSVRMQLTAREEELQCLQTFPRFSLTTTPATTDTSTSLPHTSQGNNQESDDASMQSLPLPAKSSSTERSKSDKTEVDQKSFLSPLAVDLINEKNAEISELTKRVKMLMNAVQTIHRLLREGESPAKAQQVLVQVLGCEDTAAEALSQSEEQDVLRDAEPSQSVTLDEVSTHLGKDTVTMQSPPEPLQLSRPQAEGSNSTLPLAPDSTLLSIHTIPHPQLTQTGLEEDFRSAQELLEAREAEILQLSEEVEDSTPMPLTTSLQVEQLQQTLHEVQVSKADCEAQLEELFLKNKLVSEEMKQLQRTVDSLHEEAQHSAQLLREREESLNALRQQLQEKKHQHIHQQEEVSSRLRAAEDQVVQLNAALQGKSEEGTQLLAQLEQVHADLTKKLAQASLDSAQMEQHWRQQIADMKEEHATREKELCSYYEEHMAKQIRNLTEHLSKEKEAALARQQDSFEDRVSEVMQRKEQSKEVEPDQQPGTTSPEQQMIPQPPVSEQQTESQLCASVDALAAGLKMELEKSGKLDQSVVALVRAGSGGEASTRASSALSEASDGEEPAAVNGHIQHLMNKIHSEGIEVLSLIDVCFLYKHHNKLDNTQRSLLTSSSLLTLPPLDGEEGGREERGGGGEESRLLHNLAAVEEELAKKEQEMKSKIAALDFQLEQERLSSSEWKLSYESEKQHTRDLMEQLHKERLTGAEQVSELTLLRSQLFILRLHHQKLQEENCNFSEGQKEKDKHVESLLSALQEERINFSRVSKVLSEERKAFSMRHTQQENIIKDLRCSLEKEREKIMALNAHLEMLSGGQHTQHTNTVTTTSTTTASPTTTTTSTTMHLGSLSAARSEELKVQLARERQRSSEMERACEREKHLAKTQMEQTTLERARVRAEMREMECKLSELTQTVRGLESEKERLVRQLSHERELVQHQEGHIRELEGEVKRVKGDAEAQSEAHQAMAHRMREEGAQLHQDYTRTLTKLGKVEAEVCELQHRVRGVAHELEVARQREEQLKWDLNRERMALQRLGLTPTSKDFDDAECSEVQLKQNLELCKSYLRLTEEKRTLRARVTQLQDTTTSLTQQLLTVQAGASKTEETLKMEREAWERERTCLQQRWTQWEAEAERIRMGQTSQLRTPSAAEVLQLYTRYLQSEHQRKALVWQKRYLLVVIRGYNDTEQQTHTRLTAMAPLHLFPSAAPHHHSDTHTHTSQQSSKGRFRVMGFVVMATCRMRKLVQQFKKKVHHWEATFGMSFSTVSTPDSTRPQSGSSSSSSGVCGRDVSHASPSLGSEETHNTSYTGLTPPTRGPTTTIPSRTPASISRRSLFQDESRQLHQYVERLDNIHSVLGLSHRKQ